MMNAYDTPSPANIPADSIAKDVAQSIANMDFSAWDSMIADIIPGISAADIARSAADGTLASNPAALLEALANAALLGIRQLLPFAAMILALAFIGCMLEQMRLNFPGGKTASSAQTLCFMVTAMPIVGYFSQQLGLCIDSIRRLTAFSNAAMPSLLALLTATGSVASAAMLKPAAIASTGLINTVIENGVTALVSLCAALAVIGGLNTTFKTSKLLSVVKSVCTWTLTAALSVFAAVITVQGLGASATDGVSVRTVRYAIDNYLPVVGGFFKDTYGMLVGSALIIRNAVGITGAVWIVLLCCSPLISLAVSILLFKVCAALIEPVGAERTVTMLGDFAEIFSLLFATLASVTAMCIILIGAVIACGNAAMGLI